MTTTVNQKFQAILDLANPNNLADLLRQVKLGRLLSTVKVTVAALSPASATPDITDPDLLAFATVSGITLEDGEGLPAIGQVVSLRVTASGTAASVGSYGITDPGGTAIIPPGGASAALGIAELSDDGTTLTFPNTVTGFVLVYYPRTAKSTQSAAQLAQP